MGVGTAMTLILQMGGIAIAGAFISNMLEARGANGTASMVMTGTYAVMGFLAITEVMEFIDHVRRLFHV
jgi:hypothetical protein